MLKGLAKSVLLGVACGTISAAIVRVVDRNRRAPAEVVATALALGAISGVAISGAVATLGSCLDE